MQGFLIGAYKDEKGLLDLIRSLSSKGKVYVHINALSALNIEKLKTLCSSNVVFIKKVKVTWGGFSHLEAILYLLSLMIRDKNIEYIHIISGQDLKIKSWDYFKKKFDGSNNIYMSCINLKEASSNIQKRYMYKHFFTDIDSRKKWYIFLDYCICAFQKRRRNIGDFYDIYKGMIWVSAPTNAYEYAINYYNSHDKFRYDIAHTLIPEEIFFQTVFMNSKYKKDIIKNNLRFTIWSERHGSIPAYLDESDIAKIDESECVFARKVDSSISKKLIEHYLEKEYQTV